MSFTTFRSFAENNFAAIMIACLFIGLIFPIFGQVPDETPAVILAIMMFFSYSKISFTEFRQINFLKVTAFVLFRFTALPVILYFICLQLFPQYAMAVLLLGLLPGAVMAAALSSIFKGNATLGLAGTVLSSAIAPFAIPFIFELFDYEMDLSAIDMFITLASIIFLPGLVYYALIKILPKTKPLIQRNASFWSVFGFNVFILVVVGRLGGAILDEPLIALQAALVLGFFFALFYIFGWLLFFKSAYANRVSYTVVSGCNNIGLGVSLAILYFPAQDQLYMIVCEFIWVFLIGGMQLFLKLKAA